MNPILLLSAALVLYLIIWQSHRLLGYGLQIALAKIFHGCRAEVNIAAQPLWFLSGDFGEIRVRLADLDASHFPIPGAKGESASTGEPLADGVTGDTPEGPADAAMDNVAQPASPGGTPLGTTRSRRPTPGHPARIGLLALHLSNFQFGSRHLTGLHLQLPDIQYDYGRSLKERALRPLGSGSGALEIVLSESDLNESATMEREDIRAMRIHSEEGQIRVTLDYRTMLGWISISVTGQLEVWDGHAIHFVNPSISAGSVPFPQAITDYILTHVRNLNPVFDSHRLHLPVDLQFDSIQSTEEGVTIRGALRLRGE